MTFRHLGARRRSGRWLRALIPTLAVMAALAAAGYAWRADFAVAVAQRVAQRHLGTNALASLPDGLHVGLCGAGSPFPDERRGGPCTLVIAGARMLVFDAGNLSARQIGRMGFNLGRIDGVFLTHFHSDHIDGLGELLLQRWVQGGHRSPLPVWGPDGVGEVVAGLRQAYRLDQGYRTEHHGADAMPASGFGAEPRSLGPLDAQARTVWRDGDLTVEAFEVGHAPVHPAVGYRVRYRGRSLVLSGDTTPSAAVVQAAQGADLLLHEALSPRLVTMLGAVATENAQPRLARVLNDILDYHSTPEQAADAARAAGVRMLVLHHIAPTLPPLPGLESAFLGGARQRFGGPLIVGRDGDFFSLPAGRDDIDHRQRF